MTKREFTQLVKTCGILKITLDDGLKLVSFSRQLSNIAEKTCTGFLSTQSKKWNETHEETITSKIVTLLKEKYGDNLYFYRQTDPRGVQVYIIDLDNEKFIDCFNDWVARNSKGLIDYGLNLREYIDYTYNQFGFAF